MEFQQTVLPNGLNVVAELNPRAHSAAVGFYVRTGSRDETADCSGVSHFLEHMAFKGNDRFSAADVNRVFDELGANSNAQTGEEFTLYYAAMLPEYLPKTFELLAALMQPSLREEDFEVEKQVILEEIGMYDDLPAFLTHDLAMATHFRGHSLGQSILGTKESIRDLPVERMRDYFRSRYHTGNITLVATGNTTWKQVLDLADQYCSGIPVGKPDDRWVPWQPLPSQVQQKRPQLSQTHTMLLSKAPPAESPQRFAAELLTAIAGDGESGRLYWELVDPGLAESCDLSYNEFFDNGLWAGYMAGDPEENDSNIELVREIFDTINSEGITQDELDEAFNKVASRIVIRSERPMGRLSVVGGDWIYRKEHLPVEAEIAAYRAVTPGQIQTLLKQYPLGLTTVVQIEPEG